MRGFASVVNVKALLFQRQHWDPNFAATDFSNSRSRTFAWLNSWEGWYIICSRIGGTSNGSLITFKFMFGAPALMRRISSGINTMMK